MEIIISFLLGAAVSTAVALLIVRRTKRERDRNIKRQNEFVADAAHELRTPITAITGHANLVKRWGMENWVISEKSLDAISREATSMSNLVEKLLLLTQLDNNAVYADFKAYCLSDIVSEVIEDYGIFLEDYKIEVSLVETAFVHSDYTLLKQLISIILDNSIKFTGSEGSISITTKINGDRVDIKISDTGCGINEEDLDRLFDRFFIKDKARTKGKTGVGLGLSIAKKISEYLNCTLSIKSAVNQGTTVTISLKLYED